MATSLYPDHFIASCNPDSSLLDDLPSSDEIIKTSTPDCGEGIFAKRSFLRGELIGNFLALPAKAFTQHSLQRGPDDHLIDPHFVGYLLHSCNPNVVVDMHQQKVYCVADIAPDTPLTMDYATTEDKLFKQFPCSCQSANCRLWVTGRNEVVNEQGTDFLQNHAQKNESAA